MDIKEICESEIFVKKFRSIQKKFLDFTMLQKSVSSKLLGIKPIFHCVLKDYTSIFMKNDYSKHQITFFPVISFEIQSEIDVFIQTMIYYNFII